MHVYYTAKDIAKEEIIRTQNMSDSTNQHITAINCLYIDTMRATQINLLTLLT